MCSRDMDGVQCIVSTGALVLEKLPDTLVIIGSGVIGAERAVIYHALGTTVTIVGPQDDILPPSGREIATMLAAARRTNTGELGLDAAGIANQRGTSPWALSSGPTHRASMRPVTAPTARCWPTWQAPKEKWPQRTASAARSHPAGLKFAALRDWDFPDCRMGSGTVRKMRLTRCPATRALANTPTNRPLTGQHKHGLACTPEWGLIHEDLARRAAPKSTWPRPPTLGNASRVPCATSQNHREHRHAPTASI